jgi:hypothetical protein
VALLCDLGGTVMDIPASTGILTVIRVFHRKIDGWADGASEVAEER